MARPSLPLLRDAGRVRVMGMAACEGIRTILGFEGRAWRAVRIPVAMPKPDLTALTG